MDQRIAYTEVAPDAFKAMLGLEKYLHKCSIEPGLMHLVKLRASQINGCAYCIDMHSKDLLAIGETAQRMLSLDAWRETPFFTERERAALQWTEELTLISDKHAHDSAYEAIKEHFSEKEIVDLTWLIGAINLWNRVAISMRSAVGDYKSPYSKG